MREEVKDFDLPKQHVQAGHDRHPSPTQMDRPRPRAICSNISLNYSQREMECQA